MKKVAFIPVRGGSQSIPLKNIKPLAGKPLLYWSLEATEQSPEIDEVIVATDSDEIADCAQKFPSKKLRVYRRDAENAQHTSSTESVMLEYLQKAKLHEDDLFILIQATNPFIQAAHLTEALKQFHKDGNDSLLSVVRTKRFFWKPDGTPLNFDYRRRPRRQDFDGMWMENGAFYINSVGRIQANQNRLCGKIGVYEMPEASGFEIDEPEDWVIVEGLLHHQQKRS